MSENDSVDSGLDEGERVRLLLKRDKGKGKRKESTVKKPCSPPHQNQPSFFLCSLVSSLLVIVLTLIVFIFLYLYFPQVFTGFKEDNDGINMCNAVRSHHQVFTIEKGADTYHKNFSEIESDSFFFVTDDQPLSDQEACSIESLLHLTKRKVYLVELLCGRPRKTDDVGGHNYAAFLSSLYKNLEVLLVEGDQYFSDTPLSGTWQRNNDNALFGARILTAWRFGGSAFSLDLLINSRDVLQRTKEVQISPEAIFSPSPCKPPLYFMILEIKKALRSKTLDQTRVVRKGIENFRVNFLNNCTDVIAFDRKLIGWKPNSSNYFVKAESIKESRNWLKDMSSFCRQIVKSYIVHKSAEEEVRYQMEEVKQIEIKK